MATVEQIIGEEVGRNRLEDLINRAKQALSDGSKDTALVLSNLAIAQAIHNLSESLPRGLIYLAEKLTEKTELPLGSRHPNQE